MRTLFQFVPDSSRCHATAVVEGSTHLHTLSGLVDINMKLVFNQHATRTRALSLCNDRHAAKSRSSSSALFHPKKICNNKKSSNCLLRGDIEREPTHSWYSFDLSIGILEDSRWHLPSQGPLVQVFCWALVIRLLNTLSKNEKIGLRFKYRELCK